MWFHCPAKGKESAIPISTPSKRTKHLWKRTDGVSFQAEDAMNNPRQIEKGFDAPLKQFNEPSVYNHHYKEQAIKSAVFAADREAAALAQKIFNITSQFSSLDQQHLLNLMPKNVALQVISEAGSMRSWV
ncbi:hypothetical protein BDR26DRAFT_904009 [Obelidium mucronatum]|nr:hypothetical protein BDR26DRAFT_904009 [Obelidium mucronatum]